MVDPTAYGLTVKTASSVTSRTVKVCDHGSSCNTLPFSSLLLSPASFCCFCVLTSSHSRTPTDGARAVPLPQNTEKEEERWIQPGFYDKRGSDEDEIAFCCRRKGQETGWSCPTMLRRTADLQK